MLSADALLRLQDGGRDHWLSGSGYDCIAAATARRARRSDDAVRCADAARPCRSKRLTDALRGLLIEIATGVRLGRRRIRFGGHGETGIRRLNAWILRRLRGELAALARGPAS